MHNDAPPPPPPPPPRVAIVGAGVAGLSCAIQLASRGVRCDLFDQGSRGPGGRSSSSRPAAVSSSFSTTDDDDSDAAGDTSICDTTDGGVWCGGAGVADDDEGEPLVFDHGCQFFTAAHPTFKVSLAPGGFVAGL